MASFNNPDHAASFHRFLDRRREQGRPPRCAEVCLWGDPEVLRARFVARAEPPLTDDLRPYFEAVLARDRTPVLSPPAPVFEVDTTDWSDLDGAYPAVLAGITAALGAPPRASG